MSGLLDGLKEAVNKTTQQLPEGDYTFEVEGLAIRQNKTTLVDEYMIGFNTKGSDQIYWFGLKLKIVGGEQDGKFMNEILNINGPVAWKFSSILNALLNGKEAANAFLSQFESVTDPNQLILNIAAGLKGQRFICKYANRSYVKQVERDNPITGAVEMVNETITSAGLNYDYKAGTTPSPVKVAVTLEPPTLPHVENAKISEVLFAEPTPVVSQVVTPVLAPVQPAPVQPAPVQPVVPTINPALVDVAKIDAGEF